MPRYAWTKNDSVGGSDYRRIPPGVCFVRVSKIKFGGRDGPFETKNGDPMLMLCFEDESKNESVLMLTLTEKAGWVLTRLLSRLGEDLAALEAADIHPSDFVRKEIAEKYLLDKKCWMRVEEDGKYQRLTPLHEGEAKEMQEIAVVVPGSAIGTMPPAESDIPF